MKNVRLMQGNEACVEGAAGVTEAGIGAVVIGCLAHSAAAIRTKQGAVINVRPTVRALSHFFFSLCKVYISITDYKCFFRTCQSPRSRGSAVRRELSTISPSAERQPRGTVLFSPW